MTRAQETQGFRDRAIAWLDTVVPGWHERINLGNMSLYSNDRCILGQLFGVPCWDRVATEAGAGVTWAFHAVWFHNPIYEYEPSNLEFTNNESFWRETILQRRAVRTAVVS